MQKKILSIMICALGITRILYGATYYVAPDGDDDNPGTEALPMASISNALAQSDVTLILMKPGSYTLAATVTNNKAVTIRGLNSPSETNVYINCDNRRGFWLQNSAAVLDGLVISNGYATQGAGVRIAVGGIVTNCLIIYNRISYAVSSDGGAGVWMSGGGVYNSRIISNWVESTHSSYPAGGGIRMHGGGGGVVENCLIAGNINTNSTSLGGGGVYLQGAGTLRNCVVSNNQAGMGGGVTLHADNLGVAVVDNCRVVDNRAKGSAGGIHFRSGYNVVTNCIISNNWTGGTGSGGGAHWAAAASGLLVDSVITHNWTTNRDGGGLSMLNGLVENCIIEYNRSSGNNVGGGGVHMTGGRLNNSVIRYNQSGKHGGGISFLGGGIVSNCLVQGNTASTNGNWIGGGVYLQTGGLVTHSSIVDNNSYNTGGGLGFRLGGAVVNSLVAGNTAANNGGGLYLNENGHVSSCTVVNNQGSIGGGIYVVGDNHIINTIVYSNLNDDVGLYPGVSPAVFHYSCTSSGDLPAEQGNITNAPIFTDFGTGNYRLATGSPGINAGSNDVWMATGFDLDGRPRLDRFSGRVDMGCYEHISSGALFYVY